MAYLMTVFHDLSLHQSPLLTPVTQAALKAIYTHQDKINLLLDQKSPAIFDLLGILSHVLNPLSEGPVREERMTAEAILARLIEKIYGQILERTSFRNRNFAVNYGLAIVHNFSPSAFTDTDSPLPALLNELTHELAKDPTQIRGPKHIHNPFLGYYLEPLRKLVSEVAAAAGAAAGTGETSADMYENLVATTNPTAGIKVEPVQSSGALVKTEALEDYELIADGESFGSCLSW